MNIELRRLRHRPKTIDGQIWIDGQKVCDSAENAHHSLREGCYPLTIAKNKRIGRKVPSLIRYGNGVYNLHETVILVGKYIAPGCLSHSKPAFDVLYERIRKNIERGHEVSLIISSSNNSHL